MRIIHDLGEGAHKLGRIFLSAVCAGISGWVSIELMPYIAKGEIDTTALLAILAGINASAWRYIGVKGKGYQSKPKEEDKPAYDPMD